MISAAEIRDWMKIFRDAGASEVEAATYLQTIVDHLIKRGQRRLHEKDLSGPCFVYCLFDPAKCAPFYVGISKYPAYRFHQHRSDPGSAAWRELNRLLELGYGANRIFKVFKKCPDRNAALELEHRLITSTPGLLNRDRRRFQIYTRAA